jgi:putative PIN family toxin of toxin-antitoxin system
MRVVLDTNVIVSGVLSSLGASNTILQAWRSGRFQLITSAPLLSELEDVLARPHITRRSGFSPAEAAALVQAIGDTAIVVSPTEHITLVRDPDDNRLLEAAGAVEAEYLVSGDKEVLDINEYGSTQVVTPARFVAILAATPGSE